MRRTREHVAAGDCERIRPGLIGQPSNTVSSLAFVVAAARIARHARRTGSRPWAGVALAAAAEGLGSVGYHGPGGRLAKAVHDAGLVALAVTIAVVVRTDPAPRRVSGRTLVLTGSAALLHALSRTGGPLCSCNSRLQGHAVFHVLAATALDSAVPREHR